MEGEFPVYIGVVTHRDKMEELVANMNKHLFYHHTKSRFIRARLEVQGILEIGVLHGHIIIEALNTEVQDLAGGERLNFQKKRSLSI